MKKLTTTLLLLTAAVLAAARLGSQSATISASSKNAPEFDHTTVFVRDLAKSAQFYETVVGLEKIPDPFKDAAHVWFRAGAHEQLHIIGGATEDAPRNIEVHMAFRVASVEEFARHLDQMGIKHRSMGGDVAIQLRPDGVHQIYFQDPDGYWIEINDDRF